MELPNLPCSFVDYPLRLEAAKTRKNIAQVTEPFEAYESKLRQIYAQEPSHTAVSQSHLVPVYQNEKANITVKARDTKSESSEERDSYLLPLPADKRRKNGDSAVTTTLREFQKNFSIFSESSLSDLNWNNVVAAGSSVVTALLPVIAPHNESKRALRTYYHEELAPASDVDLFIYGLDEAQAIEKIKEIEANIRDSVLSETSVIRTKNAVTIVSEYPTRHVQVVLRLYKSITEILTGFDVDCACVAYDGKQVFAAPRALAAFATQMNSIDLTRRSPSYENRLSKYSHRGFEVYWPLLDRSRVDPTIYERAFNRVQGLARLLVLEKLPHPQDRDEYLSKRRSERGRPELPWNARFRTQLQGNIKDVQPDDVAEWVEEDAVSSYHTLTIPWGPRYTPKKIERLLFQQDLLKNAEWNKSKDRETNLHRHPAFFGRVDDIIHDCCGYCPKPVTDADLAAWEEESKIFVSGDISFLKDDPGRQEIGSFHPLTHNDWTEMAYVGSTEMLCQAIVDKDLERVKEWFDTEGADVNRRDHTGRTPLQLAVVCSSPEIVQYLVERGARLVARLYNGLTALHLAAWRGSTEMVKCLLDKSAENEVYEDEREERRKQIRREAAGIRRPGENVQINQIDDNYNETDENDDGGSDSEDFMEDDSDADSEDRMTSSFIKVAAASEVDLEVEKDDDPDVYNVDVVAWDSPCSPLHLAIIAGHCDVIELLINEYSADVMLPVKLMTNSIPREPMGAIMTLLLPLDLKLERATKTLKLLLQKGASPLQASTDLTTVLHYLINDAKIEIVKMLTESNPEATTKAINHLVVTSSWRPQARCPLLSAIRSNSQEVVRQTLSLGAKPVIELEDFVRALNALSDRSHQDQDPHELRKKYLSNVSQPVIEAARHESMIDMIIPLINKGADVNTITEQSWSRVQNPSYRYGGEDKSLLDLIRERRKKLQEFMDEDRHQDESKPKTPEILQDDEHYLSGLKPGTYQYWSASKDLETAKFIQNERAKKFQLNFEEQMKKSSSDSSYRKRQTLASELVRKLKSVENRLIEEGAKTFYELYPNLKEMAAKSNDSRDSLMNDRDDYAYKTQFTFFGTDITPSEQLRYIGLFEATFLGDVNTVKKLCLKSDGNCRPLEVAVKDHNNFNLFAVAILRGHTTLASTILDIAAAQYKDVKKTSRIHYSTAPFDSDDEDSDPDYDAGAISGDEAPKLYQRLVDDKFTIDDLDAIDALPKDVKSRTTPISLVKEAGVQVWRALPQDRQITLRQCRVAQAFDAQPYIYYSRREEPWRQFQTCWTNERSRSGTTLFAHAVFTNNNELLKFLLESEAKYSTEDPDDLLKSLDDRSGELKHAMNLGQLEMVDTIIRYRGSLLPLHHLAEQSGVIVEEVPKYYQGLSVYGQKRKDWARQDQHAQVVDTSDSGSPFLDAIMEGDLDLIDYYLSDTPSRRYEEFCSRFSQDQRIRALSEGKGGLPAALKSWMSSRTNLALHIAVMAWPGGGSKTLRYILGKVPPEYLEVRCATGETPLHLAFKLGNLPACEILLQAGADQRTRNKMGYNLLHTIYSSAQPEDVPLFKKKISMFPEAIISKLLVEKCGGSEPGLLTPLALYLQSNHRSDEDGLRLLGVMLEISNSKDLTIMDGAGDYPLHVEVGNRARANFIAAKRPDLLFLENATGMTPTDVAETRYFQSRMIAPRLHDRTNDISIVNIDRALEFHNAATDIDVTTTTVEEDDDLPLSYPVYSDLVRIARKHPQPRQLVSILDAKEVARRLAGRQHRNNTENRRRQAQGLKSRSWHRYSRYQVAGDDASDNASDYSMNGNKEDEVSKWYNVARQRIHQVPFRLHKEQSVETELQKWRDFAENKTEVMQCCEKANSKDENERRGHRKMTREIDALDDV